MQRSFYIVKRLFGKFVQLNVEFFVEPYFPPWRVTAWDLMERRHCADWTFDTEEAAQRYLREISIQFEQEEREVEYELLHFCHLTGKWRTELTFVPRFVTRKLP